MTVQAVPRRNILIAISVIALVLSSIWITNTRANADEPSATPVVYIVTGVNFPDALGVGPASALARGPILMVKQTSIPTPTKNELSRLNPDRIVVVGGTAVISASVESQLRAWAPVSRIAGSNRYETAALVSRAAFPAPPVAVVETWEVYETWQNPHAGDGFALELEIYVPVASSLVISGQTVVQDADELEPTYDLVYCGVNIDEPDPDLALPGSWRYPTITEDQLRPTCASQSTILVDAGFYTVTLSTVDMEPNTVASDRSLIVTVVPLADSALLLSVPESIGAQPHPSS